ncbi:hypothetical protein APAC_1666 [Malaciobacter pacificus]|uniref:Uncharacterized protein n=1 Tax=Malaciobacter pacificus TaxID=1080223 RepID=A0A5C2HEF2_9BACT|nr:hypothetical protein APAC_1666 [Malaciobacter pacificus]
MLIIDNNLNYKKQKRKKGDKKKAKKGDSPLFSHFSLSRRVPFSIKYFSTQTLS